MNELVALEEVADSSVFGSKAVGLGQALRDGLPVPPGFALAGALVEAVASAEEDAIGSHGWFTPGCRMRSGRFVQDTRCRAARFRKMCQRKVD